jgi:hypothetical protein
MNSVNKKLLLALGWIGLVLLIALLVPVASVRGWLLTTLVAIGPAVAMLFFAREQRESMSQSIDHARR